MQMNPYLMFNGDCEAAFTFYAQCLGGEIVEMHTHGSMPAAEPVPPELRDKILHARLVAGDTVLMASDAPPGRYEQPQGFAVAIGIDDPADAQRIFDALAQNGTVQMPFGQTFFAAGFGMLVDRFGIPWMVSCDKAA